jgi:CRISPR/Cas system-associated exonuclease Cas4 (RecB family)
MTLLGSASVLHRSIECPASQHLPQERVVEPHVQEAADRGTCIHGALEKGSAEGADTRWKEECEKVLKWNYVGAIGARCMRELSLVHNGESGKCRLTTKEDRDYGELLPTDTPGTADVIIQGYRMAEVWDYKTGRTRVAPPGENPQLLHLALCASRIVAQNATHFIVGIQTIQKTQIKTEAALVDLFTLEAHEERLRKAQELAREVIKAIEAGEQPQVRTGPWCRYCDAKPACPVQGG